MLNFGQTVVHINGIKEWWYKEFHVCVMCVCYALCRNKAKIE